ncbi:hypothetical protein DAI22_04g245350 [Oryza sativa Japonica Group]|nr:hypothetical protein DAI22_04g245350 [Oryza sativa Japonica Group]
MARALSRRRRNHYNLNPTFFLLELTGAARTRTPTSTNYDVHSPTWGDGKLAPLLCAMEITSLGHELS